MRTFCSRRPTLLLMALSLMMLAPTLATARASSVATKVSEFKLDNGLQVVVVPDHRAPVVTH
jgi:zinc protease